MDSSLPPASPKQIADVYAHLHVTHRALMLMQWRTSFALLGVSLNLLLPWLLLAASRPTRLRRLGLVARIMERLEEFDARLRRQRRGCQVQQIRPHVWSVVRGRHGGTAK